MRFTQRCVGRVEVVVPQFVARPVSVRCQIQHVGSSGPQALIGPLDQVQGGVEGVPRQTRHEEKAMLGSGEPFHRLACQRSVCMRCPPILTNAPVVRSTNQRQFLVKTGLVVATGDAERDPLRGHKEVEVRRGTPVRQHRPKWNVEMRLERLPVDGLRRGYVASVENENPVAADVSGGHERPTDGTAFLRVVVDEDTDVTVIEHGEEVEAVRNGDIRPRRHVPNVLVRARSEAVEQGPEPRCLMPVCAVVRGLTRKRQGRQQEQAKDGDGGRRLAHGCGLVRSGLAVSDSGEAHIRTFRPVMARQIRCSGS